MSSRALLAGIIVLLLARSVAANVCTYQAKGRTIERVSSEEIRLVSEQVRVIPGQTFPAGARRITTVATQNAGARGHIPL
jgi:hypothetical protein